MSRGRAPQGRVNLCRRPLWIGLCFVRFVMTSRLRRHRGPASTFAAFAGLVWIAIGPGCSSSSNGEGACFGPGESCGAAICGMSGYCGASDAGADVIACLPKRAEGATCSENKECASDQCAGAKCVNGSTLPCAQ